MNVLSGKMDQLANIATSVLDKQAAVDAASLAGGGDPAAMGMDPAMAGGMDPAMAGGMDPAMAGGMDPAAMAPAGGGGDPMAGAPPGPDPMEQRLAALEAQLAAGGGGGMGGVEPIKPKIDINVEIMKMNKMIARIADALGVQIPAAEMVATQNDLTGMGMDQGAGGAAAGGAGGSAIAPIDPMQGASPALAGGGGGGKIASEGEAYDGSGLADLADRADALFEVMSGTL